MPPGIPLDIKEVEWCQNYWHKLFYGVTDKEDNFCKELNTVEFFCKKCGKKRGGYTYGTFTIDLDLK